MNANQLPRSFSIQIVAGFIAVVILTGVVVGIPAILIMQRQMDQQAWAQVEQGQRAAISLYAAKHQEIHNLSVLIAQQPTLHTLLDQENTPALNEYIENLRASAGVTRIMICSPDEKIVVTTDEDIPEHICKTWKTGTYQYNPFSETARACLTSYYPIDWEGQILGDVFVCRQLDNDFAIQMREKTGLEHTIWIENKPVSTSHAIGLSEIGEIERATIKIDSRSSHHRFEINEIPYYAGEIPLEEGGLKAEVALDISGTLVIQERVTEWIIAATLVISVVVAFLIYFASRRIAWPDPQ